MMNDRFDPNDESSELHPVDGDGQVSRFEQQLRSVQPRAPQLDWDTITSGSAVLATLDASSSQRGFSVRQMTLAVAASWLIGTFVGGSIFWSRPVPVPAPVIVQGKAEASSAIEQTLPVPQPTQRSTTAAVNSQDSSVEDEPSVTTGALPRVEFSSLVWQSDEPLSPRSLTSHKSAKQSARQLTTLRTSGSTVSASIASDASASSSFKPAPISNRQQLMEQYLQETDRKVY